MLQGVKFFTILEDLNNMVSTTDTIWIFTYLSFMPDIYSGTSSNAGGSRSRNTSDYMKVQGRH